MALKKIEKTKVREEKFNAEQRDRPARATHEQMTDRIFTEEQRSLCGTEVPPLPSWVQREREDRVPTLESDSLFAGLSGVSRGTSESSAKVNFERVPDSKTQSADSRKQESKSIVAIKRRVWSREKGRCSFRDEVTGKICSSEHALEFDHIHPRAWGGETTEENLQLLCRAHNGHKGARIKNPGFLADLL